MGCCRGYIQENWGKLWLFLSYTRKKSEKKSSGSGLHLNEVRHICDLGMQTTDSDLWILLRNEVDTFENSLNSDFRLSVNLSHLGDRVHGHQPSDEALVPGDVGQHGRVAVADGHCPGHTGVEVVIHADCQPWRFGCRASQGDSLCGVSIPGVADAIWVADGLDPTLPQFW